MARDRNLGELTTREVALMIGATLQTTRNRLRRLGIEPLDGTIGREHSYLWRHVDVATRLETLRQDLRTTPMSFMLEISKSAPKNASTPLLDLATDGVFPSPPIPPSTQQDAQSVTASEPDGGFFIPNPDGQ